MVWRGKGTIADLKSSMDEAGIDRTVIFSTATKVTQVKTINDYISGLCKENDKFIGTYVNSKNYAYSVRCVKH
jgi:hypothetical protein